jgi:hypothetical protein
MLHQLIDSKNKTLTYEQTVIYYQRHKAVVSELQKNSHDSCKIFAPAPKI